MKSGISEIIGQAVFGDGAKGTAYRALRPLVCSSCGGLIAAGDLFTRERQKGQSLRLWPRCQACLPFALESGRQTRSDLLQALLTPTEQVSIPQRDEKEHATDDEHRKTSEALRQRLGPALERARRSRLDKR
jgi:hypothetical protein